MEGMIKERIPLPGTDACATWSAEARDVFNSGIRGWAQALNAPAHALQHFHQVSGHDATLWVADHPWTDAEARQGTLITLYFGTDGRTTRAQLAALGEPLERGEVGWSPDGVHRLPPDAFPVLCTHKGQLVQLWMDGGDEKEPFAVLLRGVANRARRVRATYGEAQAADFLDRIEHALAGDAREPDASDQHKDQLKLAFALHVAHRVIEADGVVMDDELEFLARAFPQEKMAAVWLDDQGLRDQLAQQAEMELQYLLGYHEKLALLSTFFAACYADGRLEVRELKVLKEASEALGMEKTDVVAYLKRIW